MGYRTEYEQLADSVARGEVIWNYQTVPMNIPRRDGTFVCLAPGTGYDFGEADCFLYRPDSRQPATEYRVTDPVTGGQKNQKPEQMSLLPVEALKAVSRVYAFGAEKYSRDNWRLGYDWHLSYDAMQRHLMAFWGGEEFDPDSGESHLAHAVFHALTLITYQQEGLGNDDRK